MTHLHQVVIFSAGIIVGLGVLPVLTRIFNPESVHHLFERLGRAVTAPFRVAGRVFRREPSAAAAMRKAKKAASAQADPREQRINDSVQAIRSILLVLTAAIQRVDEAASSSSRTLSEARDVLTRMGLPPDLERTASHLVVQIDRVIAGNNALRGELARSQELLNTQQMVIESLRTEVRVDKMTQFANRAYFDDKLDEMIKLNRRYKDGFFLMIIDVDNFKTINDSYGHPAGDRILKGVAFKLKSALRESDFIARFGGDEFALIVIKANRHAATSLAWKLCQEVRDSRFLLDGNDVQVTLSIGAAEAQAEDSSETLLKRADAALYEVKENGRNGVKFAL